MNLLPKVWRRDWLQKVGLTMAACIVGLAIGEVALRLAGVSYPVFDVYDEVLGVKLMPGKKGWYRKEGNAYLEINSLGYRDVEHDLPAPPRTFRIAVLGDSFTEARQVPIEDTYWRRLAKALDSCPAFVGHDIEVLNFGIGGYSTTQSLLAYDLDARRFEPDLVLLGFFAGNDVRENSRALNRAKASWLAPKPYHELIDGELKLLPPEPLPVWKRAIFEGVQRSRLLELGNEARRQWSIREKHTDQEAQNQLVEAGLSTNIYRSPDGARDLTDAWALTERLLAELHRKVRNDGAGFVVATIPAAVQTHPDTAYRDTLATELEADDLLVPERQLAQFGRDDGYVVFPLVEELQSKVGDRHFHGFANSGYGRGHLNAEGHRAMAELLTGKLCDLLDEGLESESRNVVSH